MVNDETGNDLMDLGTLEPVEVSVTIGGKPYVLREASAADAAAFKNAAMSSARLDDGKVVGIGKAADAEAVLVGRCLHSLQEGGAWKPVGESLVKTWPARITAKLYDRARKISGLDESADNPGDAPGKGGLGSTASPST